MMHKSGLEPLGRAVLVRMYETGVKGGMISLPESVRRSSEVMEQRAELCAIGSEAWTDETKPRAQVGDHVIVTKFAGYIVEGPLDGLLYRLVNDRDVFCRIAASKESESE